MKGPLGEDVLAPLEPDVTDVILWDTTGLPSGHYKIHVKAKVAGRGSAATRKVLGTSMSTCCRGRFRPRTSSG